VLYAEGHANAFGVGIADEDIDALIDYINEELKDLQCKPSYKVDFIFNSSNFNGNDILEIAHLKHLWGQGVEEPYVIIENLKITKDNLHLMAADRSPTLKIELDNGTSLIKFKSSQEEFDELYAADGGCLIITALGRCAENIWNDNVYPQLILEDYEITNEVKYYF
jgi:single-stranded DNA-specific DHH superfamily exonuclease